LAWREEHCPLSEGGERGRGGGILTRTQINSLSDIETHLGGIDDRVFFILKYLLMKKKCVSKVYLCTCLVFTVFYDANT